MQQPVCAWVQEIYRRGITGGCNSSSLQFCPAGQVTNAQMAIFLQTTMAIGTAPACTAPPFTDVPCTYWAANWIAELARRGIATGCGGGNYCPEALTTRAGMATFITRAFDIPLALDPNTSRSVQFTYVQGLLTQVAAGTTSYGTLTYHPNLQVSQVAHGNGVVETQGNDPNLMRRPSSEGAAGPYASWSSGTYTYDGAGNVTKIGTSWYTYDKVSRLTSGTIFDGPTGGGAQKQQSYTFDAFGNLTNITGTSGRATPTNSGTNRLNGLGTVYDAAGNLTQWNGVAFYQYDRFNQMTEMASGGEHALYIYTADDERLWSYDLARNISHWTLRDLGGKVLRDYLNNNGRWSLGTDYIYRDGLLLAAETQTGQRHYHLDHLGTPRLITRATGHPAGYHVYYPFGEEATAFNQDTERMKFTGHERDLASPAGAGDDLDYMHARFCSPVTGRFLGVDEAQANLIRPQSWNRYSYAINNPLSLVDYDGRNPVAIVLAAAVLYGMLTSPEAANAPESPNTKMIPSGGAARALDGGGKAAAFYVLAKKAMEAFGIGGSQDDDAGKPRDVVIDGKKHPESAAHARDAQSEGHPETLTVDRSGSDKRRADALRGIKTQPEKDRDEYLPAMFKEGGKGASVRHIDPSDNRGSGSCIGNQCRGLPDGAKVRIVPKPPQ